MLTEYGLLVHKTEQSRTFAVQNEEEDTDGDRDGKPREGQNRLARWCAASLQAAKGSRAAEVLSHEPRASNEREIERRETEQGGGADEGIGELGA
jgi:hypothetical protein